MLLFVFWSIGYSQKIVLDEVDSEGMRIIGCEYFTVSPTLKLSLSAYRCKGVSGLGLGVITYRANYFIIKKNMVLLLKNIDDEVITLKAYDNFYASPEEIQPVDDNVYDSYYNISLYQITEENIKKISKGIKKIRQETTDGLLDEVIEDETIGAKLKQEFDLMEETFKTPKSIYSDF